MYLTLPFYMNNKTLCWVWTILFPTSSNHILTFPHKPLWKTNRSTPKMVITRVAGMLRHTWTLRGQVCRDRATLPQRATLSLHGHSMVCRDRVTLHQGATLSLHCHSIRRGTRAKEVFQAVSTTSHFQYIKIKSEIVPLIILHYTFLFYFLS